MHSCWVSVSSCSPYLSSLSSNNIIICFVELGIRFFVDRLLFVFLFSSCSQLLDFWLLAMYSSRFSLLFLEGYGFNSIKHHWIFPPSRSDSIQANNFIFFPSVAFIYIFFLFISWAALKSLNIGLQFWFCKFVWWQFKVYFLGSKSETICRQEEYLWT